MQLAEVKGREQAMAVRKAREAVVKQEIKEKCKSICGNENIVTSNIMDTSAEAPIAEHAPTSTASPTRKEPATPVAPAPRKAKTPKRHQAKKKKFNV